MADDQNQRPYRLNETLPRATPAVSASASDPLAELARLIGQNDPFAEFGRGNARRAAVPPPAANKSAPPAAPLYGASDGFLYQDDAETADHPAAETGGFEPDPYHPSNAQLAGEEDD